MRKSKTLVGETLMSKGKAFVMCFCGIMCVFLCLFALVALKDKELSFIPVNACLTALVTLAGGYIGFSVMNNGVKGHNWNQQMFDSENPKEGEDKKQ